MRHLSLALCLCVLAYAPIVDAEEPTAPASIEPYVQGGEFSYRFVYDSELIARTMARVEVRLVRCYERELQRDPSLETAVTVNFTIGADGRIKKVDVEHTLPKESGLPTCVEKTVAATRFPRPGLPLEVSYPLSFEARGRSLPGE